MDIQYTLRGQKSFSNSRKMSKDRVLSALNKADFSSLVKGRGIGINTEDGSEDDDLNVSKSETEMEIKEEDLNMGQSFIDDQINRILEKKQMKEMDSLARKELQLKRQFNQELMVEEMDMQAIKCSEDFHGLFNTVTLENNQKRDRLYQLNQQLQFPAQQRKQNILPEQSSQLINNITIEDMRALSSLNLTGDNNENLDKLQSKLHDLQVQYEKINVGFDVQSKQKDELLEKMLKIRKETKIIKSDMNNVEKLMKMHDIQTVESKQKLEKYVKATKIAKQDKEILEIQVASKVDQQNYILNEQNSSEHESQLAIKYQIANYNQLLNEIKRAENENEKIIEEIKKLDGSMKEKLKISVSRGQMLMDIDILRQLRDIFLLNNPDDYDLEALNEVIQQLDYETLIERKKVNGPSNQNSITSLSGGTAVATGVSATAPSAGAQNGQKLFSIAEGKSIAGEDAEQLEEDDEEVFQYEVYGNPENKSEEFAMNFNRFIEDFYRSLNNVTLDDLVNQVVEKYHLLKSENITLERKIENNSVQQQQLQQEEKVIEKDLSVLRENIEQLNADYEKLNLGPEYSEEALKNDIGQIKELEGIQTESLASQQDKLCQKSFSEKQEIVHVEKFIGKCFLNLNQCLFRFSQFIAAIHYILTNCQPLHDDEDLLDYYLMNDYFPLLQRIFDFSQTTKAIFHENNEFLKHDDEVDISSNTIGPSNTYKSSTTGNNNENWTQVTTMGNDNKMNTTIESFLNTLVSFDSQIEDDVTNVSKNLKTKLEEIQQGFDQCFDSLKPEMATTIWRQFLVTMQSDLLLEYFCSIENYYTFFQQLKSEISGNLYLKSAEDFVLFVNLQIDSLKEVGQSHFNQTLRQLFQHMQTIVRRVQISSVNIYQDILSLDPQFFLPNESTIQSKIQKPKRNIIKNQLLDQQIANFQLQTINLDPNAPELKQKNKQQNNTSSVYSPQLNNNTTSKALISDDQDSGNSPIQNQIYMNLDPGYTNDQEDDDNQNEGSEPDVLGVYDRSFQREKQEKKQEQFFGGMYEDFILPKIKQIKKIEDPPPPKEQSDEEDEYIRKLKMTEKHKIELNRVQSQMGNYYQKKLSMSKSETQLATIKHLNSMQQQPKPDIQPDGSSIPLISKVDKFREEWNYLVNVKQNFLMQLADIENHRQKEKQRDKVQMLRRKVIEYKQKEGENVGDLTSEIGIDENQIRYRLALIKERQNFNKDHSDIKSQKLKSIQQTDKILSSVPFMPSTDNSSIATSARHRPEEKSKILNRITRQKRSSSFFENLKSKLEESREGTLTPEKTNDPSKGSIRLPQIYQSGVGSNLADSMNDSINASEQKKKILMTSEHLLRPLRSWEPDKMQIDPVNKPFIIRPGENMIQKQNQELPRFSEENLIHQQFLVDPNVYLPKQKKKQARSVSLNNFPKPDNYATFDSNRIESLMSSSENISNGQKSSTWQQHSILTKNSIY